MTLIYPMERIVPAQLIFSQELVYLSPVNSSKDIELKLQTVLSHSFLSNASFNFC